MKFLFSHKITVFTHNNFIKMNQTNHYLFHDFYLKKEGFIPKTQK